MINIKSTLLSFIAISSYSLTAYASLGGSDQLKDSLRSGIYKAQTDDELLPTSWIKERDGKSADNQFPNNDNLSMSIDAAEGFHVTELSPNEILVTLVRPQDELAANNVPEQMILSRAEFNRSSLRFFADGSVDALPQYEAGFLDTQSASRHGGGRLRSRAHHFTGGNFVGGGGNCVAVFHRMTHMNVLGNGKDIASNLLKTGQYEVSGFSLARGTVCSFNDSWGGAGHVGTADGRCLQPVYPTTSYCGNPGSNYHLKLCVRPRGNYSI